MKEKIKNIFWNNSETRLRTGWRIIFTWAITLLVFLPIQAILKKIVPQDLTRDQSIDILLSVFAVVITIMLWLSRKWIDKRSFSSLGIKIKKGLFRDIIAGYTISAVLVIVILVIEISFGWLQLELAAFDWTTLISKVLYLFIVTGLVVSWWENLFFIGYLFTNFKDGCGFWCAFILCILIFGLIHSSNPNASLWSFLGIILIHSYEIFAYLRTKNLWLVLGIHAGWNFFQGLAGFNVSGRTGNQVVNQINKTPDWLGGGEFGPEAGVIIVLTALIAFTLIWYYSKKIFKHKSLTNNLG